MTIGQGYELIGISLDQVAPSKFTIVLRFNHDRLKVFGDDNPLRNVMPVELQEYRLGTYEARVECPATSMLGAATYFTCYLAALVKSQGGKNLMPSNKSVPDEEGLWLVQQRWGPEVETLEGMPAFTPYLTLIVLKEGELKEAPNPADDESVRAIRLDGPRQTLIYYGPLALEKT